MHYLRNILILLFIFSFSQNFSQEIKHEFRGVWIATVNHIDWPREDNATVIQQKEALVKMLDFFKDLNFNAVVFQIRPSADAFYNSTYEPWSTWLTDSLGSTPNPYFDPLAFIIEKAHARGMELHAWLNPYRAVVDFEKRTTQILTKLSEKPEWFINYGKNTYFNPGIPEVRKYTLDIVADIVHKYDVDAIHFDDYFYPYKIKNEHFNDDDAFEKYGGHFYPDAIDDWRRQNVNLLIYELQSTIKSIKPWVQFGISPFGVWRNKSDDPKGSETKASQTNYDHLYADVLYWMENGWLDYIVPQAYWHMGFEIADYTKIVDWWNENSYTAHVYIGQAMYRQQRAQQGAWQQKDKTEIEKQLDYNTTKSNVKGTVYFSAKSFLGNPFGLNTILKNSVYNEVALPPLLKKIKSEKPEAVSLISFRKLKKRTYRLSWKPYPEDELKKAVKYIIYKFDRKEKLDLQNTHNIIALTGQEYLDIPKRTFRKRTTLVVIPVNRNNQTGPPAFYITR